VANSRRQTLVDQFNDADSPIFAFLLTTRAGGQGLNLVGADTVILHDIDFNPQIDRQAEDRAHRIGQTRPVAIHRLVTDASVDENVYNIALRKKRCAHTAS
jgi:SWI/SNF-related matrix-associated actin-dependent regulator 1 of chromatin subfamily A